MKDNKAENIGESSTEEKPVLSAVLAALDTANNREELLAIRAKAQSLSDAEFDEFGRKFSMVNARFMTEDEKRERRMGADRLWLRLRQNCT